MILLIDNYDSFVYNLARYVGELGYSAKVIRNNAITISEIVHLKPSHIIISPGPADPDKAGISMAVIKELGPKIPILGVCLGHQAIGQVYGMKIIRAQRPVHGKSCLIQHDGQNIFNGLPNPLKVGRYHSLIVEGNQIPPVLRVTAHDQQGEIMALQHKHYPVVGVQFHPESVLTDFGYDLLQNFLQQNI